MWAKNFRRSRSKYCLLHLVLAFGCFFALPIDAHDVWITVLDEPTGTRRAVINHGHPGDRKVPDPDKLFELEVLTPPHASTSLLDKVQSLHLEEIPVLLTEPLPPVPASGLWLTAQYDNGYWVKSRHGHRNTSKRQIPDAEESLSSMKYAKAFLFGSQTDADFYHMVVGHRLEIIPLQNPSSLVAGQSISVLVQFEGKPLPDASVENGDGLTPVEEAAIPRYQTNRFGIAQLLIRNDGPQLFVVDHRIPSVHPDLVSTELYNATLSFEVRNSKLAQ